MPVLENSRWELFAQATASGKKPSLAYVCAGFVASSANACRLLSRDSVRQRVNEIQSAMAARAVKQAYYTREWVVEQLIDNVMRAKAASDYGAANTALKLLGIEQSMFVDRKETGSPGQFATLQSEQEVLKLVRAELGEPAARQLAEALKGADRREAERTQVPKSSMLS